MSNWLPHHRQFEAHAAQEKGRMTSGGGSGGPGGEEMNERIARVETDVTNLRRGLAAGMAILFAILGAIWGQIVLTENRLTDRMDRVEDRIDKVDTRIDQLRTEMKQELQTLKGDVIQEIRRTK